MQGIRNQVGPGSEPPGVWGNEMINCHDLGKWTERGGGDHKGASFLVFLLQEWRGRFYEKSRMMSHHTLPNPSSNTLDKSIQIKFSLFYSFHACFAFLF